MSKLIFKVKYADKKWPEFLEDTFSKSFAEQCVVESTQTADIHEAKIQVLDFKNDKSIVSTLKQNDLVTTAYLINNKAVIETIK
jgi:hypothetical protein